MNEPSHSATPIAAVLHEVRNRVFVAELLLQRWELANAPFVGDPGPDHAAFARKLKRVLRGIEDAVIVAGESQDAPRFLPLAELTARSFDILEVVAAASGVALEAEAPLPDAAVPELASELALFNLLDNAIKYSDPRKPDRRVTVRGRVDGDVCHVEVADNGLGIGAELLDRVFEPNFRVPGLGAPGNGLGLAIARLAVERLGGTMGLRSVPSIGTTVWLTVPVRRG